ncbi:MAG: hypothetical protein A2Y62_12805 [Candidatus Fischerbacteria bacterium RBG_13_37_8]|uniref:Uncharacterized protein n=1 Tax=Candidatus Fischerbacteria bacterium RBG_13_37_8 TaxID=1817863 RepID=A0A1F5VQD0_9BACT|nr:MAG: hypothetical protein A2Y62_12805 [Candidatus Fischerbacteria bacterium RBG_13_37_8]
MMTISEAIKTALEFENKVYNNYQQAQQKAKDPTGQKVFKTLAEEEKGHIVYLEHKLEEWGKSGHVTPGVLKTAVPDKEKIKQGVKKLAERMKTNQDCSAELDLLRVALKLEEETSSFYNQMVRELSAEGQTFFARFVEIEEGHLAIVQAEIDALTGMGFWFDMQEFQLESE